MAHSSKPAARRKSPSKPRRDYPLTPRKDGRWAKKVRRKVYIFSGTAEEAEAEWDRVRPYLTTGRQPPEKDAGEGLTLRQLVNKFLAAKEGLRDSGEITPRSFADYHASCGRLLDVISRERLVSDLTVEDFERLRAALAKTRGAVALGNEIQRIRMVLKYAYDARLIDRPVWTGTSFKKPSKRVLRKERNQKGPRMLEARHIRRLLKIAGPQMRAMILLGMNCGLGNNDCGLLAKKAVNLKTGWLDYPRPKTGMQRRCPLWPETVEAIQAALTVRPATQDVADAELVFLTKYGRRWAKTTSTNPISAEMRKLLTKLSLHRPGIGFYTLRHVFETIGGETRDQVAVDAIMGHVADDDDMSDKYRERISDQRLQAVAEHVRTWLFRGKAGAKQTRTRKGVRHG